MSGNCKVEIKPNPDGSIPVCFPEDIQAAVAGQPGTGPYGYEDRVVRFEENASETEGEDSTFTMFPDEATYANLATPTTMPLGTTWTDVTGQDWIRTELPAVYQYGEGGPIVVREPIFLEECTATQSQGYEQAQMYTLSLELLHFLTVATSMANPDQFCEPHLPNVFGSQQERPVITPWKKEYKDELLAAIKVLEIYQQKGKLTEADIASLKAKDPTKIINLDLLNELAADVDLAEAQRLKGRLENQDKTGDAPFDFFMGLPPTLQWLGLTIGGGIIVVGLFMAADRFRGGGGGPGGGNIINHIYVYQGSPGDVVDGQWEEVSPEGIAAPLPQIEVSEFSGLQPWVAHPGYQGSLGVPNWLVPEWSPVRSQLQPQLAGAASGRGIQVYQSATMTGTASTWNSGGTNARATTTTGGGNNARLPINIGPRTASAMTLGLPVVIEAGMEYFHVDEDTQLVVHRTEAGLFFYIAYAAPAFAAPAAASGLVGEKLATLDADQIAKIEALVLEKFGYQMTETDKRALHDTAPVAGGAVAAAPWVIRGGALLYGGAAAGEILLAGTPFIIIPLGINATYDQVTDVTGQLEHVAKTFATLDDFEAQAAPADLAKYQELETQLSAILKTNLIFPAMADDLTQADLHEALALVRSPEHSRIIMMSGPALRHTIVAQCERLYFDEVPWSQQNMAEQVSRLYTWGEGADTQRRRVYRETMGQDLQRLIDALENPTPAGFVNVLD